MSRLRGLAGYAGALALVLVASALIALVSTDVRVGNVSILYLPAVLVAAVRFGRGPAIFASIGAFVLYDVLFVEPRFHVTVADPREWVALVLLLVTAAVAGQLAADQRVRARRAIRSEREARLLYDVARLIGAADLSAALEDVAERVRRELGFAAVGVELADGQRITSAGPSAQPLLRAVDASRAVAPGRSPSAEKPGGPARSVRVMPPQLGRVRASGPVAIPVVGEDRRLGTLLVLTSAGRSPSRDEEGILAAVAAQIGTAIERERLRRDAADAEVLRRADEAKSALLHAVSHDLRTPLSSIIAGATSLRQQDVAWSDAEREEFLAGIEGEARRLDRLVGDLLSVSRIEAGTLRPAKDWHDVGELVDDVVGRIRARSMGHHISVELPDDLPPAMLDEVEIAQVLTNLIENAVKYAPEGTEIVVRARTAGPELRFDVLDEGPGVPAAAASRIFEPFERLAREGAKPGTGLGLAVAKRFVEAHGGRIWTEARSGGGSSFAFSVPIGG
ncbi:MAG: DUF4118 domain-containing protein [Chloroflexi bacterium]|nr:DUF4118 domain-containing protein [Chloroflexota bacterium]